MKLFASSLKHVRDISEVWYESVWRHSRFLQEAPACSDQFTSYMCVMFLKWWMDQVSSEARLAFGPVNRW